LISSYFSFCPFFLKPLTLIAAHSIGPLPLTVRWGKTYISSCYLPTFARPAVFL